MRKYYMAGQDNDHPGTAANMLSVEPIDVKIKKHKKELSARPGIEKST